jgi:hypothetical protein
MTRHDREVIRSKRDQAIRLRRLADELTAQANALETEKLLAVGEW